MSDLGLTAPMIKMLGETINFTLDEVIRYVIAVKIAAALTPLFLLSVPFLIDWITSGLLGEFQKTIVEIDERKKQLEKQIEWAPSQNPNELSLSRLSTKEDLLRDIQRADRERDNRVLRRTYVVGWANTLKRLAYVVTGIWVIIRLTAVLPVVIAPYASVAVELHHQLTQNGK